MVDAVEQGAAVIAEGWSRVGEWLEVMVRLRRILAIEIPIISISWQNVKHSQYLFSILAKNDCYF